MVVIINFFETQVFTNFVNNFNVFVKSHIPIPYCKEKSHYSPNKSKTNKPTKTVLERQNFGHYKLKYLVLGILISIFNMPTKSKYFVS